MANRLGSCKPKEVLRKLKGAGFQIDHVSGSHVIMLHPQTGNRVVVPFHVKDLKRGLLFGIIKQAGLTTEEFSNL